MATFAIAIYDNEAESDEELTFKKNDLFQVTQFDFMGMEGWWLCRLIKENKTGLAPGNRLKITTDEKLISKLKANLVLPNLTKNIKSNSIISTSSSSSSILSSSSSLSSTSTNQSPNESNTSSNLNTRFQTLSLQPEQSQKLVLPAKMQPKTNSIFKLNTNSATTTTTLTESTENILFMKTNLKKFNSNESDEHRENDEGEDYDYDIPENNRPAPKSNLKTNLPVKTSSTNNENEHLQSRKSISPTIDSGISTSSLISLNSDNLLVNQSSSISDSQSFSSSTLNQRISDYSNFDEPKSKQTQAHIEFEEKMDKFNSLYFENFIIVSNDLNNLETFSRKKEKLVEFRIDLQEFLIANLKQLKHSHACFHPDLNTYNKFNTLYRQTKDFYLYFESVLNSFEKIYKWNYDLIVKQNQNEFVDLMNKMNHLKNLLDQLRQLVNEKYLFDYHSETSSLKISNKNSNKEDEESNEQETSANDSNYDYQYEYDNNNFGYSNQEQKFCQLPESDYCEIDEEYEDIQNNSSKTNSEKLEKLVEKVSNNSSLCMTLKRNDEKIRREIRLATSSSNNESTRITLSDQMLLKFYLKHVEDNFNELKVIYDILVDKLGKHLSIDFANLNDMANKLALNGHKLVFICDTLQRNIHNTNLKFNLYESSNSLCDSLKLYMIRLKSFDNANGNKQIGLASSIKQNQLILDSINNVFSSADKFKQIVLKYFFNNY